MVVTSKRRRSMLLFSAGEAVFKEDEDARFWFLCVQGGFLKKTKDRPEPVRTSDRETCI